MTTVTFATACASVAPSMVAIAMTFFFAADDSYCNN